MRRDIRTYIENELRDYDNTKKEWELLQDEIVNASHISDGQPRGTDISRPTENKALKLISNRRLSQLERTIKAIEKTIMALPEEKFKLIQMRYWDVPRTLTDDGIAIKLNCDKRTVYRWSDGIMLALAKEMGLID